MIEPSFSNYANINQNPTLSKFSSYQFEILQMDTIFDTYMTISQSPRMNLAIIVGIENDNSLRYASLLGADYLIVKDIEKAANIIGTSSNKKLKFISAPCANTSSSVIYSTPTWIIAAISGPLLLLFWFLPQCFKYLRPFKMSITKGRSIELNIGHSSTR